MDNLINKEILVSQILNTQRKQGVSRMSGKGVRIYKGMRVRFADFNSIFLNIP